MRPRSAQRRPFRPHVEALEGRELLAVCTVDRLTDLGEGKGMAGDLRYCLTQANSGDVILFEVRGEIGLMRALPELSVDVTIQGPGAADLIIRRSAGEYGILRVGPEATVLLFGLTIADGLSHEESGGVGNHGTLIVASCTFANNQTSQLAGTGGGGIHNQGTLIVLNSTFNGNQAYGVGAISNVGVAYVLDSTFSQNVGAFFAGAIGSNGVMIISNSTISGNGSYGGAGAITVLGKSPFLLLMNTTVAGNEAFKGNGGIYSGLGAVVVVLGSIVANNTGSPAPDILGAIISGGSNLIGDSFGGTGYDKTDLLDMDPLLGPLQDNGGPTLTHALLPGSPAIDAGHPKVSRAWDQRGEGFPGVVGGRVDIGAFEVQEDGFGDGGSATPGPDVVAILADSLSQPALSTGWHCVTKLGKGGRDVRSAPWKPFAGTLWVANPTRQSLASSRNRVWRGPGVIPAAKRRQPASKPAIEPRKIVVAVSLRRCQVGGRVDLP